MWEKKLRTMEFCVDDKLIIIIGWKTNQESLEVRSHIQKEKKRKEKNVCSRWDRRTMQERKRNLKRLTLQFSKSVKIRKNRSTRCPMYMFVYLFSTCADSLSVWLTVVIRSNVILFEDNRRKQLYLTHTLSSSSSSSSPLSTDKSPKIHLDQAVKCDAH